MKKKTTARGFTLYEFTDANGIKCTLQKSSIATEDRIWLGAKEIGLKEFVPFRQPSAWVDMPQFDNTNTGGIDYVANNRMHLTRKQAKALIPLLQKFVDTGEI